MILKAEYPGFSPKGLHHFISAPVYLLCKPGCVEISGRLFSEIPAKPQVLV
jgi:hypothetical protein